MRKRLVPTVTLQAFANFLFFCHSMVSLAAQSGAKTFRNGFKNMLLPISTLTSECLAQNSKPTLRLCLHISSAKSPRIYPTRPIPSALFGTLPRIMVSSLVNTMRSIHQAQKPKLRRLTALVSGLLAREVTTRSSCNISEYTSNVLLPSLRVLSKQIS